MPVQRRLIRAGTLGALPVLGAVRVDEGIVAAFPSGTSPMAIRAVHSGSLRQVGRGVVGCFPGSAPIDADGPETGPFAGKNTLVAIRNGERGDAAVAWLGYHAEGFGAEAALIFDRDPPGRSDFAEALETGCGGQMPVIVVQAEAPMSTPGAPDARDPALAPAAPGTAMPGTDAFHAPFSEIALYELLRHRFLAEARAVAFLDIADLLLPHDAGSPFDRAAGAPGTAVLLHGVETYPWRLRKGGAAPHSDHVAVRKDEPRWLMSWAAAPAMLPPSAVFQPGRILGVPAQEGPPAQFRRSMGVVFPGAPVNRLVRRGELVEDRGLALCLRRAFGREPVGRPRRAAIPPRPDGWRVTAVTAMKNEGAFIVDWIAHHRAVGVDRFLVYTNDCEDGTDRLLDRLLVAGVVEARGCERFGLVANGLPQGPLREFYTDITRSEARHHGLFHRLARCYFDAETVATRLAALVTKEAEIITSLPHRPALH